MHSRTRAYCVDGQLRINSMTNFSTGSKWLQAPMWMLQIALEPVNTRLQKVSVRYRLLLLCLGLLAVLGSTNLLLGFVIQHREAEEVEQRQQYDRLQAIAAVREALAASRHFQGQVNVAKLIGDPELEARVVQSLSKAESALHIGLVNVEAFDRDSVAIVRDEWVAAHNAMGVAIGAMTRNQADALKLATETIAHLNRIEETLKAAGDRETRRADEISVAQITRARAAVWWSAAIILMAALFGVVFSFLILGSIVRPLQITAAALRQINAGETMVDMPPISPDEFGDMAVALRQFRDQAVRLRHLAFTDEMTGLGNRPHFDETLRSEVMQANQAGHELALLYIDVDNFSAVNDSLGHGAGDRYLREAAGRLQRFALLGAQCWRYSGDKFTVLMESQPADETGSWREQISHQAQLILSGMAEPYLLDGHLLPMSVSIGIAVFPADGRSSEHLMSSADAAMYQVKRSGRNGIHFANPALTAGARRDLILATDIRRGQEQHEFEPFYQPIVDVVAGRVVGAEALLRWRHPERGVCPAADFIPAAEASGQVHALGEICLTQVCERIAEWQSANDPIWISVNLSTRQIEDRSVISLLTALSGRLKYSPESLTLEITESAMLEQVERAQETLEEVRTMGYRLGVDDFGTGYSSMVYLQKFPIDKLKIDRSFVERVEHSRAAEAIIGSMVTLAKSLGLDVIAEGVETKAQMIRLRELGCALQQGYYFTKALPVAEFDVWRAGWTEAA